MPGSAISAQQIQKAVKWSVVKILVNGADIGTGFFVSDSLVVTAGHVIKNTDLPRDARGVFPAFPAESISLSVLTPEGYRTVSVVEVVADYRGAEDVGGGIPEDSPDIAILKIDPAKVGIGQPLRIERYTSFDTGDDVVAYGYLSGSFEGRPYLMRMSGYTNPNNRLHLQNDLVDGGLSGSPILVPNRAAACGVLTHSRHTMFPAGGIGSDWSSIPEGSPLEPLFKQQTPKNKVVLPSRHRRNADFQKIAELANRQSNNSSWIRGLTIQKLVTVIVELRNNVGDPPPLPTLSKNGFVHSNIFFWNVSSRQMFDSQYDGVVAHLTYSPDRVSLPAAKPAGKLQIRANKDHVGVEYPSRDSHPFTVASAGHTQLTLTSIRDKDHQSVLSCTLLT